ncbi:hypothetical protein F443_22543 [Phytophthora nicotianae P1569]|uniref:DDE Tnp4 domain-containing protein n=1 Tax=Phytophthora nicotianae P1569 TaxID=1317065 RepID=V9DWE7_PHYNI|nr:hypothetical protein F443_22543 [Phytophthora nicotianae P1569]
MVYEDEDDDEWLDESISIMFAMAAEGERIRKSRQRDRSSLTRADLPRNPRHGTSWECIYAAGNDVAFIITTGFDVPSFHFLLRPLTEVWDRVPIPRSDVDIEGVSRHSRRSLSPTGALALVLHFLNSTMAELSLQEIFGLTPSVCSRYVNFGLRILLETLKITPEGWIEWPKIPAKFAYYAELIVACHPSLHGAFCFIDDSNGAILCALLNAPGSWHDAAVAQDLYGKLLNKTPEGYFAIADSSFPRSRRGLSSRIKTPLKKRSRQPRILREQGLLDGLEVLVEINRELVSARQAAEWGMRSLHGSFARLKLPLPADDGEYRAIVLETCARLHQVRTRAEWRSIRLRRCTRKHGKMVEERYMKSLNRWYSEKFNLRIVSNATMTH